MIYNALENYRQRTGKYPEYLAELVPLELETVPLLPNGETYFYNKMADGFSLSYMMPGGFAPVNCHISNKSLAWYCD